MATAGYAEGSLSPGSDLDVFLQLLPRSSTGERMNPYTSTWSGVTPGDGVHVRSVEVLLQIARDEKKPADGDKPDAGGGAAPASRAA